MAQNKQNNLDGVSEEEKLLEDETQKEVGDDEIMETISKDLGLDPEEDEDLLSKLVEREKSHREKLSGAIKQKINWREKAKSASENPESTSQKGKKPEDIGVPDIDKLVDQKLAERFEQRELASLSLPDDLKTEVKELSKLKGITVREAAQLPYILSRKEEVEREERIKKATPKRSKKGSYAPSYDPAKPLNPADFDFDSKEGVKAWQEAKAARAKYEASR